MLMCLKKSGKQTRKGRARLKQGIWGGRAILLKTVNELSIFVYCYSIQKIY